MVPDDEKTERKNIRQDYKSFDKMILQLFGDEQELAEALESPGLVGPDL